MNQPTSETETRGAVSCTDLFGDNPPNDGREYDCQCARCGSSVEWEQCGACGGEGTTGPGELYEEDPLWYDMDDYEPCHQCNVSGVVAALLCSWRAVRKWRILSRRRTSGGRPAGLLPGFLPVERRQLVHVVLIGHPWQPLQHVLEILIRIDPVHPAVLHERHHHRVARPGLF